jgi:hypothetical protein
MGDVEGVRKGMAPIRCCLDADGGDWQTKKTASKVTVSCCPAMLHLEKLQRLPARHGLHPAVHVELAVDVLQVLFDRARGDHQPAADLFV